MGEVDEANNKNYVWTHKKFDIGYNENRIVEVNLTFEAKVELKLKMEIEHTYELNWKPSPITYKDRFKKYLDPKFFQHKVSFYIMSYIFYTFIKNIIYLFVFRYIGIVFSTF